MKVRTSVAAAIAITATAATATEHDSSGDAVVPRHAQSRLETPPSAPPPGTGTVASPAHSSVGSMSTASSTISGTSCDQSLLLLQLLMEVMRVGVGGGNDVAQHGVQAVVSRGSRDDLAAKEKRTEEKTGEEKEREEGKGRESVNY